MTHEDFMREALALARKGVGRVSPNPAVGAVVVKDGKIVGRGWHQRYGGPHAEVNALQEAGENARGATLYCTLEPCNHTGKTPPCAPAVAAAGIATVVIGSHDPNPVAAGGIGTLCDAGIKIISDVCEDECKELNAAFFKHVRTGLPLVTIKWAMTADGKIATAIGDSKWITSEASRAVSHGLRAEHDAVLAGIGTVLTDNPLLNCRVETPAGGEPIRQPRRVILDSKARTPADARLWSAASAGPVLIFCTSAAPAARRDALKQKGAEIVMLDAMGSEDSRPPIEDVLKALGRRGVTSVMVEGGSEILGAFVDSHMADRACVFMAPKIFGGRESIPAVGGRGALRVADCAEMHSIEVRQHGQDVMISGRIGKWEWLA